MKRRRWLLETFWGNVALLPFLALLAYSAAARRDTLGVAVFIAAVLGICNCACNMGIIVSVENQQAALKSETSPS